MNNCRDTVLFKQKYFYCFSHYTVKRKKKDVQSSDQLMSFVSTYYYKDCQKNCTVFLLYCWLKRPLTGVFRCCYSVLSAAGFDMPLMLLWACMLSSHFSPQKFSTVTLETVPGSRQCGATPLETTATTKDNLMGHIWTQKKQKVVVKL